MFIYFQALVAHVSLDRPDFNFDLKPRLLTNNPLNDWFQASKSDQMESN
jgi:hypothetical protein